MILACLAVLSCNSTEEGARYFQVVYPTAGTDSQGKAILPDACYPSPELPKASSPDQRAADAFCSLKKSRTMGTSTTNLVQHESWSLIPTADRRFALLRSITGASEKTGIEGGRADSHYLFESTMRTFTKQCAQVEFDAGFNPGLAPTIEECDGKCVNTRADPKNCGACGVACPNSFGCQLGQCTTTCTGGFFNFCDGGQVDTGTDPKNCGFCGNVCPADTICTSSFNGFPSCQSPCTAFCAQTTLEQGCGTPALLTKDVTTAFDFEVKPGGTIDGTVTRATTYTCAPPGCATDFPARCPNCTQQAKLTGRETAPPQQLEPR